MPGGIAVRDAARADLATVQEIYGHYVSHSVASFEETPPDRAEMGRRFDAITAAGLPYVVAENGGRVIGIAFAAPFRARPAYRYSVEDSVYVAPDALGQGAGTMLLGHLIHACGAKGYRQMLAVIGGGDNAASIALHARLGFERAGTLSRVGYKHGRWIDVVIMQRALDGGEGKRP